MIEEVDIQNGVVDQGVDMIALVAGESVSLDHIPLVTVITKIHIAMGAVVDRAYNHLGIALEASDPMNKPFLDLIRRNVKLSLGDLPSL